MRQDYCIPYRQVSFVYMYSLISDITLYNCVEQCNKQCEGKIVNKKQHMRHNSWKIIKFVCLPRKGPLGLP